MSNTSEPLAAERLYFAALLAGDSSALDQLLSDDFLLIDVMTGSEIARPALVSVIRSGQLKFEKIDVLDSRERRHTNASIITGSTRMHGTYQGHPFVAHSRYTHVFIQENGQWRFVTAQGTPIATG